MVARSSKTRLALVVVLATLALPLVGCGEREAERAAPAPAPAASETPTAPVPEGAITVVLPVEGMVCEGCESSIKEKLSAIDGVVSCTASHTEKQAKVVIDPAKVKPEVLVSAIGELGYKASLPE